MPNFAMQWDLIDNVLLDDAKRAFEERCAGGLLICMANTSNLPFVFDNVLALREAGMLEECIVHAYSSTRTNYSGWSRTALKFILEDMPDKAKLKAAGNPLPSGDSFTLYRGVAGKGSKRRARGYSWTDDLEVAKWFAKRNAAMLPDPGVYQTTATPDDVLFFDNSRNERDFVLWAKKVKRLTIDLS